MHPIAQRLAIHAADARRLFAVHSVVNRSQGQKATRLVGVLRRAGQTAQPVRLKILPKTNSGAHSQPPESKCSGPNESHRSTRKQESYSLKAGIPPPPSPRKRGEGAEAPCHLQSTNRDVSMPQPQPRKRWRE